MNIQGSVAVVTGGASGLGAATVRGLVTAGARVVIIDTNAERAAPLVAELGGAAHVALADVASADQVAAAIEIARGLGPLRIAVNCAGVGWAARTLKKDGTPHDLDLFRRIIEINLIGTFNVLRLAAAAMTSNEPVEGERGVIVNTASIAAYDGQIGQAGYAASKGGIVGMTLPIARDLAAVGVRVMTIAPGTFNTPMVQGMPEDVQRALAATIPNPSRLGEPAEYAALVRHIVENPYLNGEVIRIDGALRMAPK